MSTIDLRGRALDARSLRQALPRAEYDVEAALDAVRPICEDVQHRGAQALRELSERFDGVRPDQLRVPAEVLAAALEALDPDIRAALEESTRRARLVHEDQRRTDTTTQVVPGGTVTERWVPVGPGRPLRPRRRRGPGQQRHHERRARPGRRRAVAGRRQPAAARQPGDLRRLPPPHRPRRVRAAGGRGGLRRRRRAGDRDVRLRRQRGRRRRRAGRRRGRLRAGQPGHRPGQHLRRRGQAAAQGPDRHRLRGRARPRSRSWPTTAPTPSTWPPT